MSWATEYIKQLKENGIVEFRPRGNSMTPLIKSGELCRVVAYTDQQLNKNDVVLVKVNGNVYLHKISGFRPNQVQISNNQGHTNGWTSLSNVYGILDKIGEM